MKNRAHAVHMPRAHSSPLLCLNAELTAPFKMLKYTPFSTSLSLYTQFTLYHDLTYYFINKVRKI